MDDYSIDELAAIARRFATSMEVEIDADATDRIARSADGTPIDVLNRLQHVRDFAHVKGNGKITLEVAQAALKMLASSDEKQETNANRDAIPSNVRREVWRRDEGKCAFPDAAAGKIWNTTTSSLSQKAAATPREILNCFVRLQPSQK